MKAIKTKRSAGIAAVMITGALLLSACSGGSAGGATSCKSFLGMNDSGRNSVVESFGKEEGEDSISSEEAEMASGVFQMMCQMVKDDSVKLKDLDKLDEEDLDVNLDLDELDIPDLDDLDLD